MTLSKQSGSDSGSLKARWTCFFFKKQKYLHSTQNYLIFFVWYEDKKPSFKISYGKILINIINTKSVGKKNIFKSQIIQYHAQTFKTFIPLIQ